MNEIKEPIEQLKEEGLTLEEGKKLEEVRNNIEKLKGGELKQDKSKNEPDKYLELNPTTWVFMISETITTGVVLKEIKNDRIKKQEEWRKEKGIPLGRRIEDEELKAQEPKIPEDLKSGLATPDDIIKAVLGLDIEKRMEKNSEIKEKVLKIITHDLLKNLRIVYNPPPKILKMMDQWPYH